MKKTSVYVVCCLLILSSCSKTLDDINLINQEESSVIKQSNIQNKMGMPNNIPNYSLNEIIVQYAPGLSPGNKVSIRNHYNVNSYDVCASCIDEDIEKWNFGSGIDIENKLGSIEPDEPIVEGLLNADREFDFDFENENYPLTVGSGNTSYASNIISGNNNLVTIAVLDTGIDVNAPVFNQTEFLRDGSVDAIPDVISGWDFVNNDDNCYDDYEYLHGTAVASIVSNTLNNLSIPHQILPVKVSDATGKASYFDILCGLSFSLPRADVVQISMGWYDTSDDDEGNFVNDIFSSLIESYSFDTVVVTSAGNNANNNEAEGDDYKHYPSNYKADNLLAIASSNADNTDIAYFSNYGIESVDYFAPGENIPFGQTQINGTSFSAPLVSAIVAKLMYESGMSIEATEISNALNVYGQDVSFSENIKEQILIQNLGY